jgi:hypothetical protein
MSELEIVTITLSFVLGFGVTQILTGVVDLVRAPNRVQLDWMPLAWAWFLFVFHVQIWFGVFRVGEAAGIDVPTYMSFLAAAVLLFLGGGLILPSQARGLPTSLLADFDLMGRRALVPFVAFLGLLIYVNTSFNGVLVQLNNVLDFLLLLATVAVLVTDRRSLQRIATIAFAVVQTYGFLFVWARPGS